MQTEISAIGDVTVVTLDARLDSGSVPGIQSALETTIAGQRKVLLDLHRTSYVSSAGLRLLLLLHRKARQDGGQVAIASVPDEVREVLNASGFLSFLAIADTVQDGVERLAA
jgi:anti-sigma B factor antagonist